MKIGDHAGKVWKCLQKEGPISFSKVLKATRLNQREADRAIGWLAREHKIKIDKKGPVEVFSLVEE
jgi:hypothetical protein